MYVVISLIASSMFTFSPDVLAADAVKPQKEKKLSTLNSMSFSASIEGLPEVIPSKMVQLSDGQSYTLTAYPVKQKIAGKWVRRLSYNGMIPGPHLRAVQGSTIKVKLINNLELQTTLHPHGLRVEEKFDGVPGVGQPPIEPKGSYDYELRLLDGGQFWYHPHIRDDYTQDSGLYGLLTVDPKDPTTLPSFDREIFLTLDDVGSTAAGQSYDVSMATYTLMGRFGDIPYLNGGSMGAHPEWKITQGEVVRFYILNAANTRTFRFALEKTPLTLIGSDGGYFEKFETVGAVTLGPSERTIVQAKFETPGSVSILHQKPTDPWTLGKILIEPVKKNSHQISLLAQPKSRPLDYKVEVERALSRKADFSLSLKVSMDHSSLPMGDMHTEHEKPKTLPDTHLFYYGGRTSGVEWDDDMAEMNAKSNDKNVTWKMIDLSTGQVNMAINWDLKLANFYKIKIINDVSSMHPMQHPIHFHGQQFVVTSVNGIKNPNLVWKDTTLVGTGDEVELILHASNKGRWMAHCHILEHLGAHMMMGFRVN